MKKRRKNQKPLNFIIAAEFVVIAAIALYGYKVIFSDSGDEAADVFRTTATSAPVLPEETPETAGTATEEPAVTPEPAAADTGILFCGDVLLDGSVRNIINSKGLDAVFPAEERGPFLNADIVMINLEMPMSDRGSPVPDKAFTFRGTPSHISLLTDMGTDIVSLANNHALDYGVDAFTDTLDLLDGHGIMYVGGGRDRDEAAAWKVICHGGKDIAFLAASRVIPYDSWRAGETKPGIFGTYDPTELNGQIALAKQEADCVIVYVHWGVELNTSPDNWQREMAYGYIAAGADAVIGSHPHILQGFEFHEGKFIAYSLGNFIFTNDQKDTAALEVIIGGDGDFTFQVHPYQIINRSTYQITDPNKMESVRNNFNRISFNALVGEDWCIYAAGD